MLVEKITFIKNGKSLRNFRKLSRMSIKMDANAYFWRIYIYFFIKCKLLFEKYLFYLTEFSQIKLFLNNK
jgi:hypothetical protein